MPTSIGNPGEQWPHLTDVQVDFMQFAARHTRYSRQFEDGTSMTSGYYQIPRRANELLGHFVVCTLEYYRTKSSDARTTYLHEAGIAYLDRGKLPVWAAFLCPPEAAVKEPFTVTLGQDEAWADGDDYVGEHLRKLRNLEWSGNLIDLIDLRSSVAPWRAQSTESSDV